MAKYGPSIVLSDPKEVMPTEAMSYIQAMESKELGELRISYKTMRVNELKSFTALISKGMHITQLNIKLTEHPGEQGFALNVRKLVKAILDSASVSACRLEISALAFDLNCQDKLDLNRAFASLPDEHALANFALNEGQKPLVVKSDELLDEDSQLFGMMDDVTNAALALPKQVQGGILGMYDLTCQGLSNLSITKTLGALTCVGVPCTTFGYDQDQDKDQDQDQNQDEKMKKKMQ